MFRLHAVRGEGRTATERKAEAYSFQAMKFAAASLVRSLLRTELSDEWEAKIEGLETHVLSDFDVIDTIVGDMRLSIRRIA